MLELYHYNGDSEPIMNLLGEGVYRNGEKIDFKVWFVESIHQAEQEMLKKYTEDIDFLKKLHSMELDKQSFKKQRKQ